MPRLWDMLLGNRHEPQRQRDLTVQTLTLLCVMAAASAPVGIWPVFPSRTKRRCEEW